MFAALALVLATMGCDRISAPDGATARYRDDSHGDDWPGYGRTFGQQHYSPLEDVNAGTVAKLGLSWSMDLPPVNSVTQPIAIDGILYFAAGLSVVHAVDAVSGRLLWTYDPGVAEKAGLNLRGGWGVRGLSWWDGRLFVGTQDGRLIAIDAKSGKPVWSVQTLEPGAAGHINGAPRVYGDTVVIGFAGSTGVGRGYISAYDAATGRRLWRFFTTPGDPANGHESDVMAMAAKTWAGTWWRFGGGADVWNAIAYDPETDMLFFGTGSGYPWNRRVRSADKGDNLFVASIVAVDGTTGVYRWHYQTTPGDTWDFDATMDIELAEIMVGGKPRKVLMQAPKNGFFYVIDRMTGELLSAEPITKVTWAKRIDIATGRPVEMSGARYPGGKAVEVWPTSLGAHNWMSMAYSPKTGLAYIPAVDWGAEYRQTAEPGAWSPPADRTVDGAVALSAGEGQAAQEVVKRGVPGRLIAWSPTLQKAVWSVPYPTYLNGGAMATGGGLVFQGSLDGYLRAFAAKTGALLWKYDVRAPVLASPITYRAGGRQYVTVLTGLGMGYSSNAAALAGQGLERYGIDPRSQARRVLTFAIGGEAVLPPRAAPPPVVADPGFRLNGAIAQTGAMAFHQHCSTCHGSLAVGSVQAPDLRRSAMILDPDAFATVVKDGALVPAGMPAFGELDDGKREAIRHYIRAAAAQAR